MDWQGKPLRSSDVRPEILAPGAPDPSAGYRPPDFGDPAYISPAGPAPVARTRGKWAFAPATYVLLAINLVVFVPMLLSADINARILDLGANSGDAEIGGGEWWRLLTSTFIHNGIIHFATNMWCLWNLGLLGEPLLGSYGLLGTYLLTGVAGSLLSTAVHPAAFSVGASGAIFGLAGVLIMLLKSPLLPVPRQELNRLRRSVIMFAVLNFVIGGGIWLARTGLQIDNMAHLGGFLSGLALGIPLLPRIGAARARFVERQWIAYGGGAFALLLLAYGIYRSHSG